MRSLRNTSLATSTTRLGPLPNWPAVPGLIAAATPARSGPAAWAKAFCPLIAADTAPAASHHSFLIMTLLRQASERPRHAGNDCLVVEIGIRKVRRIMIVLELLECKPRSPERFPIGYADRIELVIAYQ